jgi:hypothetical protein
VRDPSPAEGIEVAVHYAGFEWPSLEHAREMEGSLARPPQGSIGQGIPPVLSSIAAVVDELSREGASLKASRAAYFQGRRMHERPSFDL